MLRVVIRRGTYRDSITLMKASNEVSAMNGVRQAAIVMATPTNLKLLKEMGLLTKEVKSATRNDLVIAIVAKTAGTVEEAVGRTESLLTPQAPGGPSKSAPKTIEAAMDELTDANFVAISVPGEFAGHEALSALQHGLNVFLFSSNVPLEKELDLKRLAKRKGVLMMGPDCGTAIIDGKVLGFGNAISRGPVGIVSASGTGLQQVSTLLDTEGVGISQAIGTGSRDLSQMVGGSMTLEGLKRLGNDRDTRIIVLVSKPPDAKTSDLVLKAARRIGKPVVVSFIGGDLARVRGGGLFPAETLEDAAGMAVDLLKRREPIARTFSVVRKQLLETARKEWSRLSSSQRFVRGLYSGGTLCYEAQVILSPLLGGIYSNTPLESGHQLKDADTSKEHSCVDLGSEEFVMGRPHPMIDYTLRKRRLVGEANDPETAIILLDIVLGYGSNQDPAGELIPSIELARAISKKRGGSLSVVTSVLGTSNDPQGLKGQVERLEQSGVVVMPSNAQAVRFAALVASRGKVERKIFGS
jgi:succinyl-CoA synthetase alpha subunit